MPDLNINLLRKIYVNYLHLRGQSVDLNIRIKIWSNLLKEEHAIPELFAKFELRSHDIYSKMRMLMVVALWMSMINNPADVIKAYKQVLPNPHIKKIAQLRILSIALENKQFAENNEVTRFLKSSEPPFFDKFRKYLSSYDIYKMIHQHKAQPKNLSKLKEIYAQKCRRFEDKINLANQKEVDSIRKGNFFTKPAFPDAPNPIHFNFTVQSNHRNAR